MTWVMVPVPEEFAPQVEALIFQLKFQAEVGQWDDALIGDHLVSLADEPRTVLSAVAAGVLAGRPIEDTQLAQRLGVSMRELLGLVREANEVTVGISPGDLLYSRYEQRDSAEAGTRRRRVFYMLEELAQMVRAKEEFLGLPRMPSPTG